MINEIFNNISNYAQIAFGILIIIVGIKLFTVDKFTFLDVLYQKLIGKEIKISNKKLEEIITQKRDLLIARANYPELELESVEQLMEILACCDRHQIPYEKAKYFKKYFSYNPNDIEKVKLSEIPDQSIDIFFGKIMHHLIHFLMAIIISLPILSGNFGSTLIIGKETKTTAWLNSDNTVNWFNPITSSKWELQKNNCTAIKSNFSEIEAKAICKLLNSPNSAQNFIENSTQQGNIAFVVFMTITLPYSMFLRREREKYAVLNYYRKQMQKNGKDSIFIL